MAKIQAMPADELKHMIQVHFAENPAELNQDVMLLVAYITKLEWYMLGYDLADIAYILLTGNSAPVPPSPFTPDNLEITDW